MADLGKQFYSTISTSESGSELASLLLSLVLDELDVSRSTELKIIDEGENPFEGVDYHFGVRDDAKVSFSVNKNLLSAFIITDIVQLTEDEDEVDQTYDEIKDYASKDGNLINNLKAELQSNDLTIANKYRLTLNKIVSTLKKEIFDGQAEITTYSLNLTINCIFNIDLI